MTTEILPTVEPLERKIANDHIELATHDDKGGFDGVDDAAKLEAAAEPTYTTQEESRVRRKMDTIMLPILCLMNLCAFLDKANIGNANTAGMSTDLHLSKAQYNLLLTIFYVIYTCCQWEFILLKYVHARYFMSGIVLAWGLASCLQGVTHNFGGMLACRIVIASLEAGGGPAVGFYFSLLYPRREYGLRWAIFQCTSCLANCFAGAMAYGLVQAHTALKAWKLVFIVESAPTFLSAILLLVFLPSRPNDCMFLTTRENEINLERVQRGLVVDSKSKGYNMKHVVAAAKEPFTYLIALIHFFGGTAFNSLSVFLSQIIKDMGYSSIDAQGLTAPPWIFAYIVSITCAYLSDRWQIRSWFILGGQLVGGVGYLVIAYAQPIAARYFAVYITVAGVYLAQPLMFSWCSTNGESDSKRAFSMVLFLVTGQLGSIMGSNIYNDSPRYHKGNSICAGGLFINVFLTLLGIWYVKRRNAQKNVKYGVPVPGLVIPATEDGSEHPDFRWVL